MVYKLSVSQSPEVIPPWALPISEAEFLNTERLSSALPLNFYKKKLNVSKNNFHPALFIH